MKSSRAGCCPLLVDTKLWRGIISKCIYWTVILVNKIDCFINNEWKEFEVHLNISYDILLLPVVNFINVKRTNFLYERTFWQLLLRTVHVTRKAAEMTFVQKTRAFYVDEIDTFITMTENFRIVGKYEKKYRNCSTFLKTETKKHE